MTRKPKSSASPATHDVDAIVATLRRMGSARVRGDMTTRYGVPNRNALGVPIAKMQALAKKLGRSHELQLRRQHIPLLACVLIHAHDSRSAHLATSDRTRHSQPIRVSGARDDARSHARIRST